MYEILVTALYITSPFCKNPYVSGHETTPKVEPSYQYWAPWIGEGSRRENLVFNTEYRKCPASHETDCEGEVVPEEVLNTVLRTEKVSKKGLQQQWIVDNKSYIVCNFVT